MSDTHGEEHTFAGELTRDEFRFLTWPRMEMTRMVIEPEPLRANFPLDNSRLGSRTETNPRHRLLRSDLGRLSVLPLEIVYSIFDILD